MSKKNALSVSSKEVGNNIINNLFNDIDFSGLGGAIENMAEHNRDLTDEDKDVARGIINEWNSSVIGRLSAKSDDMTGLLRFFNPRSTELNVHNVNLNEFGPEIADKTNTKTEYEKVIAVQKELINTENNEPIKPAHPENCTQEEKINIDKKHETAEAHHHLTSQRLRRELNVSIGKWKALMNETTVVQDLIKEANKFERGLDDMVRTAKDSSQLAKLNVSIPSESIRESLKELLVFSKNI